MLELDVDWEYGDLEGTIGHNMRIKEAPAEQPVPKDTEAMIRGIRGEVGKVGFEGEGRGTVVWRGKKEEGGWIVRRDEEGGMTVMRERKDEEI